MSNTAPAAAAAPPAIIEQAAPVFAKPVALAAGANVGAVSIETERAIAEAQGQLILAKRFPRDMNQVYAEAMEAARLPALANVAFYAVPRGGSTVSGPSIRLAEELARICGNIEYGHRELSRTDDASEVEVYAWDKQTNTRRIRQITIPHYLDTRQGPRKLRDNKEIDDLIANKASKQMRGQILALIPAYLRESVMDQCRKTITDAAGQRPLADRIRAMIDAFSRQGVTVPMLEARLGHSLDDILPDDLVELSAIHTAIRDGEKASDYFGAKDEEGGEAATGGAPAAIKAAAAAPGPGKGRAPTKKPETAPPTEQPKPDDAQKAQEPAPQAQQAAAATDAPAPAAETAQAAPQAAPAAEAPAAEEGPASIPHADEEQQQEEPAPDAAAASPAAGQREDPMF